jgi:hypothetical protein
LFIVVVTVGAVIAAREPAVGVAWVMIGLAVSTPL